MTDSSDGTFPAECHVQGPSKGTLEFIAEFNVRRICEVGAYKGFTSLEILRTVADLEYLHIFDFVDRIEAILASAPQAQRSKIRGFGNTRETFASYNDSLFALLKEGKRAIYDYVFLDGSHTFVHDALAFFLLDQLLEPRGFLEFDDYDWALATSPTQNPEVFPMTRVLYSENQISQRAIADVIEHLVKPTGRYEEIRPGRLFRKLC